MRDTVTPSEPPGRAPNRFRLRLTAAFVIVAAVSAGVLALLTLLLAREYRWRNFRSASLREVRVALVLAPQNLDGGSFNRLREAYEQRSEADLVAVQRGAVFSSSPSLDLVDVPRRLLDSSTDEATPSVVAVVDGRSALVVATDGPVVARATLRPVAAAAEAAQAIAGGHLGTRLPAAAHDEFGALAASFNHMADELQELIGRLHESALREQRFTADVAHELRTPLTGMSASASVLEEQLDELPAPLRRPAAVLVADVRRLRDLVLELLELVRLDRATEPISAEPLEISDAVAAVVASADIRRDADVEVDVDEGLVVLAEPQRLRRILGNLIDNAVVHGAGTVRITGARAGPDVLVRVSDDGPGVAPADTSRIFERFYKSDASRAVGGSGLGLSIARQHAVALNGDLTLDEARPSGASFILRLPSARVDDPRKEAPVAEL